MRDVDGDNGAEMKVGQKMKSFHLMSGLYASGKPLLANPSEEFNITLNSLKQGSR